MFQEKKKEINIIYKSSKIEKKENLRKLMKYVKYNQ